jgi:hypothetical protein
MPSLPPLSRLSHWLRLLLSLCCCACTRSDSQRPAQRFSEPVKTLRLLQAAIQDRNWASASECFSLEIRQANAAAIGTEAFYLTDYWTETRTAQALLGPPPILAGSARFEVVSQSEDSAEVRVSYPDRPDKDMRLQRIGLVREPDGAWKVADVYGERQGRKATDAGP